LWAARGPGFDKLPDGVDVLHGELRRLPGELRGNVADGCGAVLETSPPRNGALGGQCG
jgi:hypothetical protein